MVQGTPRKYPQTQELAFPPLGFGNGANGSSSAGCSIGVADPRQEDQCQKGRPLSVLRPPGSLLRMEHPHHLRLWHPMRFRKMVPTRSWNRQLDFPLGGWGGFIDPRSYWRPFLIPVVSSILFA